MSKSIHTTYSQLKGLSKNDIDNQVKNPDSILHELVKKSALKKVIKQRRKNK